MTIEIQNPELEALIHQRMQSGQYEDIEDILMQALLFSPLPKSGIVGKPGKMTPILGSALVEAMQACPDKEFSFEFKPANLPRTLRETFEAVSGFADDIDFTRNRSTSLQVQVDINI